MLPGASIPGDNCLLQLIMETESTRKQWITPEKGKVLPCLFLRPGIFSGPVFSEWKKIQLYSIAPEKRVHVCVQVMEEMLEKGQAASPNSTCCCVCMSLQQQETSSTLSQQLPQATRPSVSLDRFTGLWECMAIAPTQTIRMPSSQPRVLAMLSMSLGLPEPGAEADGERRDIFTY